jgi:hypothetical protein
MKCEVCGITFWQAEKINKSLRIYPSSRAECGTRVRCFDHDYQSMPDFGTDWCAVCGSRIPFGAFCNKCGKSRSGRNLRHVHGKDCNPNFHIRKP